MRMRSNNICILLGGISLTTTLLCGMGLSGLVSATDDSVDEINVTVPVSCTFSNTTTDGSYTVSLLPGNYDDGVGSTTMKVFCNDNSGFSIYAIGYSNDEYGNTDMVSSSSSIPNIVTGTATSGNTSNWAMKIAKVAGAYAPTIIGEGQEDDEDFTAFHEIPDTYTKVATFASVTDNTVGSSLTTTYLVYVNPIQAPGAFTGKVKYTLVHPEDEVPEIPVQPIVTDSGMICYYKNANDAIGVMDTCQDIVSGTTEYTLWASNFSREGYGFAGWSDKFDWVINENDGNGNGTGVNAGYHIYGPNATISLNTADYSSTNNGLSLYAVWVKAETGTTMQTFDPTASVYNDSNKPIGSVIALKDARDDDVYAVAKLADGKWWMIENLRLDYDAIITTSNTQSNNGQLGGVFAGLAEPESPWADNSTTANSLYSTDGSTTATISGNNLAYRFPRYNNQNTDSNSRIQSNYINSSNVYSYGNYYTWPAAVADTEDHTSGNVSYDSTSICPSGWHLPRGGNNQNTANNEFLAYSEALIGAKPANYDRKTYPNYTGSPEGSDASNDIRSYPHNFLYSGYVYSSSVSNRGSSGYYWSSTVSQNYSSYRLYLSSFLVCPGTSNFSKHVGLAVRCTAGS